MNKEEILKKSRSDNFHGDERDVHIKVKAVDFGVIGFEVTAIIIGIINVTLKGRDLISNELLSVVCGYGLFRTALIYKETYKTRYVIYALGNLVLLLASLYFFIME